MIFKIIKKYNGWEVIKTDTAIEPLNKVFKLLLCDIYVVYVSIVIPAKGEIKNVEANYFTSALYEGIKLIEKHKEWKNDFGQI